MPHRDMWRLPIEVNHRSGVAFYILRRGLVHRLVFVLVRGIKWATQSFPLISSDMALPSRQEWCQWGTLRPASRLLSLLACIALWSAWLSVSFAQDQCLLLQPSFSPALVPSTPPPPMHCMLYASPFERPFCQRHIICNAELQILPQPRFGRRRLVYQRYELQRVLRPRRVRRLLLQLHGSCCLEVV